MEWISPTTALAAAEEGFRCVAIERDADSWRTAVDRLEAFYAKSPLFNRMEAV